MTIDPLPRTRRLSLAAPAGEDALARARLLPGVLSAALSGSRGLDLAYDLRRVTLDELEPGLAQAGVSLSRSLPARLLRAWAAFKDQNRRDQSRIVHQCCNHPPARPGDGSR